MHTHKYYYFISVFSNLVKGNSPPPIMAHLTFSPDNFHVLLKLVNDVWFIKRIGLMDSQMSREDTVDT